MTGQARAVTASLRESPRLGLPATVAYVTPVTGERRARYLCLRELLATLTHRHATHIVFAARQAEQDAEDRRALEHLRATGQLAPHPRLPPRTGGRAAAVAA